MKVFTKLSSPITSAVMLMIIWIIIIILNMNLMTNESSLIIEWELLNMNSIILNIPIMLDKISVTFSSVVMIISFSVMMFSSSYMSNDKDLDYFIMMVLLFVLSMNLLIYSSHLISLLLGWDGLGLTSYLLVIYYSNEKSLAAGMLTVLTNRIGDALLILSSAWMLSAGHWNLMNSSHFTSMFVMMMILLASMTKSAQMPFSAWLPAAMAAPTPVSALVHSSTLVTAGLYLIIRFYPSLSEFKIFNSFCLYTGVMTCLMASTAAAMEVDLKKLIALSTLSQLGVMMTSLGLSQPMLAFFHLITHALFKALLFICAGNIIHTNSHNQDIRLMGNLSSQMPLTSTIMNAANIALCGLPYLAGFYSKDLIIETFMNNTTSMTTGILLMISLCLTSAYTMKLSLYTLWSPLKSMPIKMSSDQSKSNIMPYMILVMGTITSGANTSWALNMPIEPLLIPMTMKLTTLTMITIFAMMMYLMVYKNMKMIFPHFTSSMWFLNKISSFSLMKYSFKIGKMTNYNELTWMEYLSGKGIQMMYKKSINLNKTSNVDLSKMMSLMTVFTVLLILLY